MSFELLNNLEFFFTPFKDNFLTPSVQAKTLKLLIKFTIILNKNYSD